MQARMQKDDRPKFYTTHTLIQKNNKNKKKYCPQNHTKLSKPITRYHNHVSVRITPKKGHVYSYTSCN